jgi:tetratricopeptide (TPR) repeat protein
MTKRLYTAAVAAVLFLLAGLPFIVGGVSSAFINLDDPDYILKNTHVRAGLTLAGARWALTGFHSSNWHPLTWLSHMADVSLYGVDASGHHLTSIALHAAATALLFLALFRLTGARWASAFTAAIFGVHPLRVESVAWVAERKDVLSGLFFCLTLLAYERYCRRGGAARYLLVALSLALGLMAKPMLVTVPGLLLLLDFWPLGRMRGTRTAGGRPPGAVSGYRLIAEKVPLAALTAASVVMTLRAQSTGGSVVALWFIPLPLRLANAVVSSVAYLGKMLWPADLAIYYPFPLGGVPAWKLAAAVVLLAAAAVAALACSRRCPALAAGALWYLWMLLPVIGLVQVGQQALADRYTYLPGIGIVWGVIWTLLDARRSGAYKAALCGGLAVVVLVLTAASVQQVRRWKDSESLFRHTLAVTSDNWLMHKVLGDSLVEKGRFAEAVEQYRASLKINPLRDEVNYSLGNALHLLGRSEEAIAQYRWAISLRPDNVEAMNDLGNILDGMGRKEEALGLYRESVRLRPDFSHGHNNLGAALQEQGRYQEALAHYREALRVQPGFPEALYNLANALAQVGRRDEAIARLREFLVQRPDYEPARRKLDALLASPPRGAAP